MTPLAIRKDILALVAVASLVLARATSAQAPLDTAARIDSAVREIQRLGAAHGESIWPGYRPDTFAFAFVLPSHGAFLAGWRGDPPAGFSAVPQHATLLWREGRDFVAASTSAELGGRPVAQVVLLAADGPYLVSTAFHEAFHVFERSRAKHGATFGEQENAFVLSTYPVFDVDNEAAFALEGRILARALASSPSANMNKMAREFVAVRRDRHRRLDSEEAAFDRASEMNEGLAEYALVRALHLLSSTGPVSWRADVARALDVLPQRLNELTGNASQSLRLRYYATGPAMALLLDALEGPAWKRRLVEQNVDLQDELAHATYIDAAAEQALAVARAQFDTAKTRADAVASVVRLAGARQAKADSVLRVPGVRLTLLADSLRGRHDFNLCGFDPQNHLQISAGKSLQMRWWKPCGGGLTADLSVPSVHDEAAGSVVAIIGAESEVKLTIDGREARLQPGDVARATQAAKIESPRVTVTMSRAEIRRTEDGFVVRPLP